MPILEQKPGIAALLVIDVQDVFLDSLPDSPILLQRCCFACKAAALLEIPIVITEQVPDKLGNCHPEIIESSPGATVFPKETFSAMKLGTLIEFFQNENVSHLILAGLETPICVYQSAIEALRLDFQVTLLTDCISGRRPNDASAILTYLGREPNCHLLPSESVFYSLLGDANHPRFREFTDLVKSYQNPPTENA